MLALGFKNFQCIFNRKAKNRAALSSSKSLSWFHSVMMAGYPIPTDDVVGRLLRAQQRHHSDQPICRLSSSRGIERFSSRRSTILRDPHIDNDAQFGVTPATLADFIRHDELHPAAGDVTGTWYSLDYTYVIEEGPTVLPKPPIKEACVSVTGRHGAGHGPPELDEPRTCCEAICWRGRAGRANIA